MPSSSSPSTPLFSSSSSSSPSSSSSSSSNVLQTATLVFTCILLLSLCILITFPNTVIIAKSSSFPPRTWKNTTSSLSYSPSSSLSSSLASPSSSSSSSSSTSPSILLNRESRSPSLQIVEEAVEVICKNPMTVNKPVFVFIVGSEGTGHHLLAGLISKLPNVFVLNKVIRQYFAEIWEPTLDEERRSGKIEELKEMLLRISKRPKTSHFLVQSPFEMYSFPYDDPRNHLRRPDLLELISIVEPIFDLRLIVTLRDEANSIASLVRRDFWSQKKCQGGVTFPSNPSLYTSWPLGDCGYIGLQARVVEDSLIYISSQLEVISQRYYRTITYENYLAAPISFVRPITRFLGYKDWRALLQLTRRNVRPHREDYTMLMTDSQKDLIRKILGGARRTQWKYLLREDLEFSMALGAPLKIGRKERCFQIEGDDVR